MRNKIGMIGGLIVLLLLIAPLIEKIDKGIGMIIVLLIMVFMVNFKTTKKE